MMKFIFSKIQFLVAGGLFLAACSTGTQAETQPENAPALISTVVSQVQTTEPQPAVSVNSELDAYFQKTDSEILSNCHSEKGYYDDYDAGKTIPADLISKYKLYTINLAPKFWMEFKENNPGVVVKGVSQKQYLDKTVYVYCIGINLEAEEAPEKELMESRLLIVDKNGEIFDNYFLGGCAREIGKEEYTVCRKVEFEGKQLRLELFPYPISNPPSHLRMKDISYLEI